MGRSHQGKQGDVPSAVIDQGCGKFTGKIGSKQNDYEKDDPNELLAGSQVLGKIVLLLIPGMSLISLLSDFFQLIGHLLHPKQFALDGHAIGLERLKRKKDQLRIQFRIP